MTTTRCNSKCACPPNPRIVRMATENIRTLRLLSHFTNTMRITALKGACLKIYVCLAQTSGSRVRASCHACSLSFFVPPTDGLSLQGSRIDLSGRRCCCCCCCKAPLGGNRGKAASTATNFYSRNRGAFHTQKMRRVVVPYPQRVTRTSVAVPPPSREKQDIADEADVATRLC